MHCDKLLFYRFGGCYVCMYVCMYVVYLYTVQRGGGRERERERGRARERDGERGRERERERDRSIYSLNCHNGSQNSDGLNFKSPVKSQAYGKMVWVMACHDVGPPDASECQDKGQHTESLEQEVSQQRPMPGLRELWVLEAGIGICVFEFYDVLRESKTN